MDHHRVFRSSVNQFWLSPADHQNGAHEASTGCERGDAMAILGRGLFVAAVRDAFAGHCADCI